MALGLHPVVKNLGRAPGFTALVVVTLAVGVGASTAMFSVVDAVVIRPLPYPHANRLTEIWTSFEEGAARAPGATASVMAAVRHERGLFESVAAYQFGSGTLTGTPEPELLSFASLSPEIFGLFPTAPVAGRLFAAADATSGERVILVSESLWSRHFGRDPEAVGKTVMIDDVPQRIVGVLPARFKFPEGADAWRPVDVGSLTAPARVQAIGLRRPGVTAAQVDERLEILSAALGESGVLPRGQHLFGDVPLQMRAGRSSARWFYVLFAAVSLLLLVACVNVSNLMLVRASGRSGELAVRAALGAGRGRLLREAALESALLAGLGGGIGLWMASGLLDVILALTPEQMRFLNRVTGDLDWRAVGFAVAVTAATCLVFGLLPAWRASRSDAIDALKQQSRSTIGGRDDWWQGALVSIQLALVVVLLAGAGLLLRSFIALTSVDLGFRTDGLALMQVQLSAPRFTGPGTAVQFMQDVKRRVEAELGVTAAVSTSTPGGFAIFFDAHPEVEGLTPPAGTAIFGTARVSPDFFAAFDIPLVAGRTFAPADGSDAIVINETAARRFFGTRSPVGRRFKPDREMPWHTVVGVAGDVKARGPNDGPDGDMEFYRPLDLKGRSNFMTLSVPAGGNLDAVLARLKRILWDVDPGVPVLSMTALSESVRDLVSRERFVLLLSAVFTIVAVLIAAVGVYGVSAYWVARRRRELAIRLAVGASPRSVASLVIGRSIKLTGIGAVVGLVIAWSGARVMSSLLFATEPRDPVTFVAVTILLAGVSVVSCVVPAARAARVDPMSTLRAE